MGHSHHHHLKTELHNTSCKLKHRWCIQQNELFGERKLLILFGLYSIYIVILDFLVWPSLMNCRSDLGIEDSNFSPTSLEQLICNLHYSNNLQCGSRQKADCRFSVRNAINTANIKVTPKACQENL